MLILCYSKCSTCKKALKWLNENGYEYELRDIKENNPTIDELKNWHKISGLPLKRFFNTSGDLYRSLQLKDKLKDMTDEQQYELLSSNGMLVKRPLIVNDKTILLGFKENDWSVILK